MSKPKFELDKAYDPKKYEAKIYAQWENSGAFKPNTQAPKDPFTIILPPPNANGHIHMGTAMFVIEDIMTRYRRMQGHKTLWLPGMDHAGIETQVVYERELAKEGKSRFDLGRKEFYAQVDAFTKKNMGIMTAELKSMGFSLDWSRLTYTLDPKVIETVYDTFRRLHDDGYIYRANRIVNWCPHCRSAFADIEVKYREQTDPLYYIKYGPFVLATVRPETKFGDTAIAVNPKDERYQKYIGQTIEAEDLNGPIKLQVIADDFVNPEFGTGVVKVTPAHDPNDWEMGQRHHLEVKLAIGTDGLLTELTGRYAGMPVAEARQQVAHDLEEHGLMDHIDMNYTHSVGYHDRCGTLIEPLVIEQWWLKVDELKKPVIKAIKNDDVVFVPARFKKIALDWMENLHDWNIGRQNWWGIRIPVYYNSSSDKSKPEYIVAADEAEAKKVYGEGNYEAETDNFDTWFSSGQWPYATLMATGDFDKGFYPTSVMETGRDIIFLWVTRMIMFGLYRTGQVPFKTVYLHGLVTDEHGKKMSKSKGNVINPLDMTAKYGTDALRLALTIGITPGNDGPLSERKIEGYRNFANKLWNVARFIIGQLPQDYSPTAPELSSSADHWIQFKLDSAAANVTKALEDYRFSEAGQIVYALLWDDFADWYVETAKIEPNFDLLLYALRTILALLHPIAPFVTEAIWGQLPGTDDQLITADWPVVDTTRTKRSADKAAEFDVLRASVSSTRSYLTAIQPAKPQIRYAEGSILQTQLELAAKLLRIPSSAILPIDQSSQVHAKGDGLPHIGVDERASVQRLAINLKDYLVVTQAEGEAYRSRLESDRTAKQAYLKSLGARLANEAYVKSAPADVVQDTRDRHAETLVLLSKLDEQISALKQ
jgi:valyl-tRNA synthetase